MLLAYLVAGCTATVLVTAVGWFWRLCFEHEGAAGPRSAVDDAPPAPDSTLDGAPPAPAPPLEPTPPASDPTFDDALSTPDADGSAPAPDSPVEDTPPGSDSLLDATPPASDSPLDDAPPPPGKTAAPAAPPAVRWSWRSHRQSGLEFLRVTVTNPGPNPLTVTAVRLRAGDELARHGDPPAGLLDASDRAVELFGQDAGAATLPRTLEPEGGVDAYFPCRDVADWLYGVAESHNLDRNECHLTPECVDDAGDSHLARRKIDYERWLRHGNGPSLREHADGQGSPSDGDDT